MIDSGSTAAKLWDNWLPVTVKRQIVAACDSDAARARATAVFLAAVHDIGKVSVAFASQVPTLSSRMVQHGMSLPAYIPREDRLRVPHSLVSHVALQDWLVSHRWDEVEARRLAVVVGGHHGVQPSTSAVQFARSHSGMVGTGAWHDVRVELLDVMSEHSGFAEHVTSGGAGLTQQSQALLTALVIVSDWIASSTTLFPTIPLDVARPRGSARARTSAALTALDLPARWAPEPSRELSADDLLRSRFGLGPDASARPVQRAAVRAARQMTGPGLLVIEAPTGEGKTEAALLAAEILAARCGSGGCFVALPTQATADAMFSRVLSWLSHLPDAVLDGGSTAHAVALAHGKAGLNRAFRDLGWAPPARSVGLDEIDGGDHLSHVENPDYRGHENVEAYVHGWFSGRKKATLADFAVGTIDQLLFTSLKARHLPLRHLGVASKVVILDEVHAVDVYMDTYLLRAVEWCGAYGVPVIALSATLPQAQRARLHAAYAAGRAAQTKSEPLPFKIGRQTVTPATIPAPTTSTTPLGPVYPVITSSMGHDVTTSPVAASSRSLDVTVELLDESPASLVMLLGEALSDGGCALVVCNTVSRATALFDRIQAELGGDVTLMHSRFVSLHRSANDAWLRESFGAPGAGGVRPRRSIVVATQVVEQSLDIDFDLLVTDLAPMDLLVQRMGRLHRHDRDGRPARLARARCVITGVDDWTAAPPRAVPGSRLVYGEHLLLRTTALLRHLVDTSGVFSAPADVAPLVQATYGDDQVAPPSWHARMADARTAADSRDEVSKSKAEQFLLASPRTDGQAILGWIDRGVGEADEDGTGRAQVRDSDDSCEVILIRRSGSDFTLVDDIDREGTTYFTSARQPDTVAELIAACTVRIPGYFSHKPGWDNLLDTLENTGYFVEWQRDPLLRGQLVLVLDEDQTATVAGFRFSYTTARGLEVTSA